ncbi:MAG TPA: leucyl/phenylalanyl-tRNA--protein transferase [Chloroflexota bacterium]|nr:leucyl/phenylalanyl-tRNA--protein transferase [Chloroflexota bacterium]
MVRLPDRLDPEFLIRAYASGIFPMGDAGGHISWYAPDPRAILEHDNLYVSRSLRTVLRRGQFTIRVDTAFETVMRECAAPRPDGAGTWISGEFIDCYTALHHHGFTHSVEAWHEGRLVGGLYGVSIGAAFMGESMFSRLPNASRVCLVALVARLRERGFLLHDTQFLTPHLESMGGREISRAAYQRRLRRAIAVPCSFS